MSDAHQPNEDQKKKLLEMAKNGDPRPKASLAGVLDKYTNSNSNSYDPVGDKEIRELAPRWFV
jgi:hypothetical protein